MSSDQAATLIQHPETPTVQLELGREYSKGFQKSHPDVKSSLPGVLLQVGGVMNHRPAVAEARLFQYLEYEERWPDVLVRVCWYPVHSVSDHWLGCYLFVELQSPGLSTPSESFPIRSLFQRTILRTIAIGIHSAFLQQLALKECWRNEFGACAPKEHPAHVPEPIF